VRSSRANGISSYGWVQFHYHIIHIQLVLGIRLMKSLTRPYVFDTPFERRMHFTNDATQSAMLLADPDALICQYTRKMMAFLLFNPNPKHIIMIGLGGGSVAARWQSSAIAICRNRKLPSWKSTRT
jgi:hypothetical protein